MGNVNELVLGLGDSNGHVGKCAEGFEGRLFIRGVHIWVVFGKLCLNTLIPCGWPKK